MYFFSCFSSRFFEDAAFFADDDPFLGFSLYINGAADVDLAIFPFREFFGEYANGMGHFVPCADEELFADDFLDDISFRLVRHHIIREIFRSFRQVFDDTFHQFIQIFAGFCGKGNDFCKWINFAVLHDFLQYRIFFDEVDF